MSTTTPTLADLMHCAIAESRWDECFALLAKARAAGRREAFEEAKAALMWVFGTRHR